ncbi:MAG: dipeptidase [Pseudomonadota bacterium]
MSDADDRRGLLDKVQRLMRERRFDRILLAVFASAMTVPVMSHAATPDPSPVVERAKKLSQEALIVDTHIDVPYRLESDTSDVSKRTSTGDFDAVRAREGGLNALFLSIYIPAFKEKDGTAFDYANKLIDKMERIATANPDVFEIVTTPDDLEDAVKSGKIAWPMGMENGAPIDGKLENLAYFAVRGIRYITLTHSRSNHIADSSYDISRQHGGLSEFGKRLIPEMHRHGVMVDISHVSDAAFWNVMAIDGPPPIASHSSPRAFTPGWERNMSDEMIKALEARGGVIMINFGSAFLRPEPAEYGAAQTKAYEAMIAASGDIEPSDELREAFNKAYREKNPYPYATLSHVADQIDHVVKLVGIDYVGLGSDFDGVGDSLPNDLKSVADYPNLTAELIRRGYSDDHIRQILGGNIMRVWREVEAYANAQGND